MIFGPLMIAAALALRPSPADPVTHRGYLQGAGLIAFHPPATTSYHRVSPNLRGTAPGVSVAVGGFLSSSVGLEGELFYGRTVSGPQHFSYDLSEDYIAGSRDVMLSELLRYRPGGRSRVELVAGGGYTRTTVSDRSIVVTPTTTLTPPSFPVPDRSNAYNALSLTGGVDAAIPLARRAAVTPMFRLRWIHRPDATTGESRGIGDFAVEFGAGVRFW